MTDLTEQGIAALKEGRREEARQLLMDAVMQNPRDAAAWLWLAGMLDDDSEQRADCLRCVLEIEPDNTTARIVHDSVHEQLARFFPAALFECGDALFGEVSHRWVKFQM